MRRGIFLGLGLALLTGCGRIELKSAKPTVANLTIGKTTVNFNQDEVLSCGFDLAGSVGSRQPGRSTNNRVEVRNAAGYHVIALIPSFEYDSERTAGVVVEQGNATNQVTFSVPQGGSYSTTLLSSAKEPSGRCLVRFHYMPKSFQITCNEILGTDGTRGTFVLNAKCSY